MVDTLPPPTETPGSQMSSAARALRRGRRPAAEAAEAVPEPIPAGYSPEQWAEVKRLHKGLGKDHEAVARDLHRFDNPFAGQIAPEDGDTSEPSEIPADKLPALHEASRRLEQKALKRYMGLKAGIGQRLQDSLAEYQEHRRRSARIMDRIAQ